MPTPPIIIIKKKGGHGGHHGGAWKVAYADFVTAMMALFIVLWLMNSSKPIQVAISGYFKDPSGTGKETGSQLSGKGRESEAAKLNKEVSQVRGFADQRLRNPKNPLDPSNRRISIIVQYLSETNTAGENKNQAGVETSAASAAKTESEATDKNDKKANK